MKIKKKILITGANGRVGSSLVKELITKYDLILVDPYDSKIRGYSTKATIILDNIENINNWKKYLKDIYCVIHLAAAVHWVPKTKKEEDIFITVNAEATKNLYLACTEMKVERFLFFSTNDVYKSSKNLIDEKTEPNPESVYGKSKLLAEKYLKQESLNSNVSVCIFRPASIYGNNIDSSMTTLIKLCNKGIVPYFNKGNNAKALLYIEDLIFAVLQYLNLDNQFDFEIFNISSDNYRYRELIDTIKDVYDCHFIKIYIPKWFIEKIAKNISFFNKLTVASEIKMISSKKINIDLNFNINSTLKENLYKIKETE